MSWRMQRIADLGRIVTGKTPPTNTPQFYEGEYLFVTPSDLDFHHYYCRYTQTTITEEAKARHINQFVPENAVMFTCIGNTTGKCALASAECLTNQQINTIVPNDENDAKFIYYLLNNNIDFIKGLGSGAATPIINKTTYENIKLLVPELPIQQRIAAILSPYDDLIENNRRRIWLLEDSARLLYKEWFVYLRFPGHEHVKVVDGVPEGWEKAAVPEIIEINPSVRVEKGKEIWYIPMSSLSETGTTLNKADFERRTQHTSVRFEKGDVLFPRITPCLENGKTTFIQFLNDNEIACGSTEFIVLRGKRISGEFTYCLSRTYEFRENAIKSMVGSSGRQRVQTSCFDEFIIGLPPKHLLDQFDEFARHCFHQIKTLEAQNDKLKQARDLLLPRLMNGEIEV